jgi:hypothetical protein
MFNICNHLSWCCSGCGGGANADWCVAAIYEGAEAIAIDEGVGVGNEVEEAIMDEDTGKWRRKFRFQRLTI